MPLASPGSGLMRHPTKPSCLTHRSNSGMQLAGTDARALGQPADAAKYFRVQLGLTPNDVVGLFHEPVHELGLLAVHHLVRTGRDNLHVGAHFLQLVQMRRSAEDRLVQGLLMSSSVAPALPRPCAPRWEISPALYT